MAHICDLYSIYYKSPHFVNSRLPLPPSFLLGLHVLLNSLSPSYMYAHRTYSSTLNVSPAMQKPPALGVLTQLQTYVLRLTTRRCGCSF